MKQHEPCPPSDLFLGNQHSDTIPDHLAGLKTIRLGAVAYGIHGDRLPDEYRPLFIDRTEAGAYDRIMMARFRASAKRCR